MVQVLVFISLDAVAQPLLQRMLKLGRLPHCAEILRRGRTYSMESTPLHASVYRTLYTGRRLGTHGSHYPTQWCAGEQRMKPAEPMKADASIFMRLDRMGRRTLVIDPPECNRFNPSGGIAVCGWQFTTRFVLPEWYSSPKIKMSLRTRFGPPAGCHEVFGPPSKSRLTAMRSILQQAPQRLADAALACLREGTFDLIWLTFAAAHIAGHQFWRESSETQSDSGEDALLTDIYERTDTALGLLLAELPASATIILFSPNGMGPETSRADLLPSMLAKVLQQDIAAMSSPLARLRTALPTGLRAWIASALSDATALQLTAYLETGRPHWRTIRAFAVTSDGAGFVRLNLKGREREGIVTASDAEKLLGEIAAGLQTFVEPSGEKVVRGVLRPADLDAPGPKSATLPDLVVLWSRHPAAGLRKISSPQFGEVIREGVGSGRVGNHCDGAWACVVPGERWRHSANVDIVQSIDFAATACTVLGVPAEDLPGRPFLH
jgi:predicted AlkP superfamily phosphohydrolase/phosphomutase